MPPPPLSSSPWRLSLARLQGAACHRPLTHHHQRRSYLRLQTLLNPRSQFALPKDLPSPPRSVILLATPDAANSLTADALSTLTNGGATSILAATVDSVPGLSGLRTRGLSYLITSHNVRVRTPQKDAKSITFTLPSTKITLPLANTLFQTGKLSTFFYSPATMTPIQIEAAPNVSDTEVNEFAEAQEDVKEMYEELGDLMALVGQKTGLSTAVLPDDTVEIKITEEVLGGQNSGGRIHSELPLKALTPPRKITAGMGNILRQLEDEPASRELEKAVPAYLETAPASQERVAVFARLTSTPPDPAQRELLLTPGTRIHRVLSGGGGWGSKAGLLSLDPQGAVDVEDFARNFEDKMFDEGEKKIAGGIVNEGEYVQFYVAEGGAEETEGISLGCVGKLGEVPEVEASEEELVKEGLFGAASEEGIRIEVAGKWRGVDVPAGRVVVGVAA